MAKPSGFELVLVNNGSSDATSDILSAFKAVADFPVVLCEEPIPGLARARNTGWRASKGDIIAFTDDDCYVAPDFAQQVLALFAERPIDFYAGRILLFDPEDYPLTIQVRSREREFRPRRIVQPGHLQGANFGFTRAALLESGGFDQRLGAGTPFPCEDVEMAGRLSAAGKRGLYSPHPLVWHHHRRRAGPDLSDLKKQYAAGRGAYFMSMLMTPGMRLRALVGFVGRWVKRSPGTIGQEITAAIRYRKLVRQSAAS